MTTDTTLRGEYEKSGLVSVCHPISSWLCSPFPHRGIQGDFGHQLNPSLPTEHVVQPSLPPSNHGLVSQKFLRQYGSLRIRTGDQVGLFPLY